VRLLVLSLLVLCGCPKQRPAKEENRDPYRNVTPQKVQEKVEKIQQQEDQRNDRRMEELK
jgi:hypothetical protein